MGLTARCRFSGSRHGRTATPLPRFVIAKKHGYAQCGLLVPNCYFDDLKRWAALRKLPLVAPRGDLAALDVRPPHVLRAALRTRPH